MDVDEIQAGSEVQVIVCVNLMLGHARWQREINKS